MAKADISEAARLKKRDLMRKYETKEAFTNGDVRWMDKHDWHPVDERPMKKEFIESILKADAEKPKRVTVKELLYG